MEISDAIVKAFIDAIPVNEAYVDTRGEEYLIDGIFDLRKALSAALSTRETEAGAVKHLDWKDRKARALGLTYIVSHYSDPLQDGNGNWIAIMTSDLCPVYSVGRFHSEDDAKTAAQDDYERRILSAIASPAPHVAEGWRDIRTAPKDGTKVDLWGINHLHPTKAAKRVVDVAWGPVRDWMGN